MNEKYTLLIIEDCQEDQMTYQRYLSKASSTPPKIIIHETGAAALDCLLKNDIDCILLDYQLPDMSGLDFFKKLQNENYPKVPVVMLTGQGNEKIAVEALKLGAFDYLVKGELQGAQLHQTILNAIEKFELINILELQKAENEFLAYHDALTGLTNRRQFEELAQHALLRAKRFNKKFAIFALDLDGFKQVNDTKGHHAGDEVLKEVGKRFNDCIRKNDILGRMGGDEFSIILEDLSNREDAQIIIEKLIASLEKPIALKEASAKISVSIGIAIYPENGDVITVLMKKADEALYEAKQAGKCTFRYARL